MTNSNLYIDQSNHGKPYIEDQLVLLVFLGLQVKVPFLVLISGTKAVRNQETKVCPEALLWAITEDLPKGVYNGACSPGGNC